MADAVSLLLEHLEAVKDAFRHTGGDARRTHEHLRHHPVGVIPWETFQSHALMLLAAWEVGYRAGHLAGADDEPQGKEREIPSRQQAGGSLSG